MPAPQEFVAYGNTEQEIADYIGVDWLIYQDIEDLKECALGINEKIEEFDCSVFDGVYVTGSVDDEYLERIESKRNDEAKSKRSGLVDSEVIELHNQA